ncbi:MAG: ABC transporter substrate-binding protein [Sphaerochaeta sp.]|jgi:iron complex transport system substrate-binding protein
MIKHAIMLCILCFSLLSPLGAQATKEEAKKPATAHTVTVTHDLGTTEVPVQPKRVLVFDLGALDILDEAGIEVVGLGRGATLPDYLSDYTDQSRFPLVGSLHEPDFETVFEMQPDLILIGARAATSYEELSKIAPTVHVALPGSQYMQTLAKNIDIIGAIFPDTYEALRGTVASMEEEIQSIKRTIQERDLSALFLMVNAGSLSVFGQASRFSLLYDDFGFAVSDASIQSSTHGQSSSFEYLLQQKPDHLFVLDRASATGAQDAGVSAKALLDNSLLKGMQTKITYVDPTSWYVASGGINATRTMIEDIRSALL